MLSLVSDEFLPVHPLHGWPTNHFSGNTHMEKTAKPTLIYVASFPYSGSTIFSIALGNSPKIINIGEANYLENDWEDEKPCFCQKTLSECPFWSRVKKLTTSNSGSSCRSLRLENDSTLAILDSRDLPLYKRLLVNFGVPINVIFPEKDLREYADRTTSFLQSLFQDFDAHAIVDASKNLRRLEVLRLYSDLDIKVIVLKRQAHDLLKSRLKRAKRRNPRYSQIISPIYLIWVLYHRLEIRNLTRSMRREEYLDICYEDFLKSPSTVSRAIENWLGRAIDLGINDENIMDTSNSHIYTGNVGVTKYQTPERGILLRKDAPSQPHFGTVERIVLALSKRIKI